MAGNILSYAANVPTLTGMTQLLLNSASPANNVGLVLNNSHIKITQTTPPTVGVAAGAGTGASASLSNATDACGLITLNTGTLTLALGIQATVTFNQAYNVAPIIVLTPNNSTAALLRVVNGIFVTSTTTTFSIRFALADVGANTFQWYYHCFETQ